MKKLVINFFVLGGGFFLNGHDTLASETKVNYDLNNHQLLETFTLEEQGEKVTITILDNSLFSRMPDKTYTVSKSKNNAWTISYKVNVKKNKITAAHSGQFTEIQGSFSNTSVKRHSDSLAIGKGSWKYRSATNVVQAKTTVSNNQLVIQ
ncbi:MULTISPECIES: DUF5626 family protein [Vagococcus]|uniref:DUF5626 domain-containing protein n=1 Tax=Vagococcus fluvialis bH819 TaxID=1255619 RepID=A0A1X6WL06_9ENTE|nr:MULTISPECIES: DUF5626 family protein [Vagococcus]SLM85004.1 hypothetical protein FM121_02835 [Vagococcus fluvialis bH819]HCM88580.1 hypothetical protein [Vagococcus sp.]